MTYVILHPQEPAICQTWSVSPPWWAAKHCGTCTCQIAVPQIEHGYFVRCGFCGKTGIVPDPGHEQDFMPKPPGHRDQELTKGNR